MKLIHIRLTASSLLEASIAMVVISLILTIGLMTVGKVMDTSTYVRTHQIQLILEELAATDKDVFTAYTKDSLQLNIQKTVSLHPQHENMLLLSWKAYTSTGDLITQVKKITPLP